MGSDIENNVSGKVDILERKIQYSIFKRKYLLEKEKEIIISCSLSGEMGKRKRCHIKTAFLVIDISEKRSKMKFQESE